MAIQKVALTNKSGKVVEFSAGQVDYMLKHGWSKSGAPEADPDSTVKTDPEDTTEPEDTTGAPVKSKTKRN